MDILSGRAGIAAAAFFALLLAVGAAFGKAHAATGALEHEVRFDRPIVPADEANTVYLMVRLHSPREAWPGTEDRPPVNMALVLDRSGSMEDRGKLEYAKRAAKLAVDQLRRGDRLAIVEYDDRISVLWPSGPVENPYEIKRRIDSLTPRGSTNLTGGMMRGVDEVLARIRREDLSRVVLLSDGLANQGVTDPYEIGHLVRHARHDGVRISAIGLGLDYDENLMQAIAESGGGNYHYVEHPGQIARVFEEELSTLVRTTARDIELRLAPGSSVREAEIISIEDASVEGLSLGDMYAGETRTLMLKLAVDPANAGPVNLGVLEIAYADAREGGGGETFSIPLGLKVSADSDAVEAARNEDVVVEAKLVETERAHARAIAAYEAGDREEADGIMADLASEVQALGETTGDARLATKLEALNVEREQMATAAAPDDRSAYLKGAKQRLYQAQSGKRALYALKVGDEGLEVERLQQRLADAGYWSGNIDGVYTEKLAAAVDSYQADRGITRDGTAGPSTLQELGLY